MEPDKERWADVSISGRHKEKVVAVRDELRRFSTEALGFTYVRVAQHVH